MKLKILVLVVFGLMACGGNLNTQSSGPRFNVLASQDMDGYTLTVICDNTQHVLIYHSSSGSVAVLGDTRMGQACNIQ